MSFPFFQAVTRHSLWRCVVIGLAAAGVGCSLVTVPVKTAGKVVETTVKTTGNVAEAPFKAAGGYYREPEPAKK